MPSRADVAYGAAVGFGLTHDVGSVEASQNQATARAVRVTTAAGASYEPNQYGVFLVQGLSGYLSCRIRNAA
jgi:hypothetical protein